MKVSFVGLSLAGRPRPGDKRRPYNRLRHWIRVFAFVFPLFTSATANPATPAALTFLNPIAEGADPWVIQHAGAYYWCFADGYRGIAVHRSDRLTALGEKHLVYEAPESGPNSRQLWAPELHRLDDRWYIYVAASDGKNENHRMIALESERDDPLGPYRFKAEFHTGDDLANGKNNRWAIDGTVLEHEGKRYFIWSGWEDERDEQWLYIAPMRNPWSLSGPRVRLCDNDDFDWERVDENPANRGLHEAPQILQREGRTFIAYSASASWQASYKLGLLALAPGGNPLKPADWFKQPTPAFQASDRVWGVGHNAFTRSPDGREDWIVYHAKLDLADGWKRALHAQRFDWRADGTPDFGTPVAARQPVPVPSGQPTLLKAGEFTEDFRATDEWHYYGHRYLFRAGKNTLRLGGSAELLPSTYQSGEKIVLQDRAWRDCIATAKLRVENGGKDAGILFRVTDTSLGFDGQRGYYAGIVPARNEVILGRMDGERWQQLGQADVPVAFERDYTLQVSAVGDELAVALDGKPLLSVRDAHHPRGGVGLRVVTTAAVFSEFAVTTPSASGARSREQGAGPKIQE